MDGLEKEYRSGRCRIRVESYVQAEKCPCKTGEVVVYFDDTHKCWKIRVEALTSRQAVYTLRLRDQIKAVSLTQGRRLQVVLVKNFAKIYADIQENDLESISRLKSLEYVLKRIKNECDPGDVMTSTPLREKPRRLEAVEVADIVSGESSDDCVLFNEPSKVHRLEMRNKAPGSGGKNRHVPSRAERILAAAQKTNQAVMDKENLSEDERASSFYNTSAESNCSTPNIAAVRSLNSNVRITPSKTLNYSMRKPGLLPSPVSGSARSASSALKQSRLSFPAPKLVGFSNLGNTCYLNATLQSLLGLAPFYWDLVHNGKQYRLLKEDGLYRSLLRLYHAKSARRGSQEECLVQVKQAISSSAKRFSGYEQHDAQEFLAQVLDQLSEETQEQAKADTSDHAWINPVVPNFEVEVEHSIKCESCDAIVSKNEQLYILSVEVPKSGPDGKPGSIQLALERFFRPERIEYKCEKCGHDKSTVYHLITKLPRIIIVHLKRWYYDCESQSHNKISKPVTVPTFVTLSKHCNTESAVPRTPVNPSLISVMMQNVESFSAVEVSSHGVVESPVKSSSPHERSPRDRLGFRMNSPKSDFVDNDLERAMAMSRQQYRQERQRLNFNQALSEDELKGMNDDDQLRAALEMSMMEEPFMIRGHLPEFNDWASELRYSEERSMMPHMNETSSSESKSTVFTSPFSPEDELKVPQVLKTPSTSGGSSYSDSFVNVESDDAYISPGVKRPRTPVKNTPNKLKRTSDDSVTKSNESGSNSSLTKSNEYANSSATTRSADSSGMDLSGDNTGLKGGHPLEKDQSENESQSDEKCENCREKRSKCSCFDDGDFIVPQQEEWSQRPGRLGSDCMCGVYQDPSKCLLCRGSQGLSRSMDQFKRVYSPKDQKKGIRAFERKFEPHDEKLAWVVEQTRKMGQELLNRDRAEVMDDFENDLEKATKLSLSSNYEQTENDLIQQAIKQSLMDQSAHNNTNNDSNEDEEFERVLQGSRRKKIEDAFKSNLNALKEVTITTGGELECHETGLIECEPTAKKRLPFRLSSDDESSPRKEKENRRENSPSEELKWARKQTSPGSANDSAENVLDGEMQSRSDEGKTEHSYGLVSVVSHLGSSALAGHYIADVYDPIKGWLSYDDSNVSKTNLGRVREDSQRRGYVFFYMAREVGVEVDKQIKHPLLRGHTKHGNRKLVERSPNVEHRRNPYIPRHFEFR